LKRCLEKLTRLNGGGRGDSVAEAGFDIVNWQPNRLSRTGGVRNPTRCPSERSQPRAVRPAVEPKATRTRARALWLTPCGRSNHPGQRERRRRGILVGNANPNI